MTHEEKVELVKQTLGLSDAQLKAMTQTDTRDERLDQLVKVAQGEMNGQLDEAIASL